MATIMAAFLTTITVPILVMTTRFAWSVPGFWSRMSVLAQQLPKRQIMMEAVMLKRWV